MCVYICMCVCMYIYVCIYMCIYMCGYICLKHSFFPYLFCPHSESHIAKLLRHEPQVRTVAVFRALPLALPQALSQNIPHRQQNNSH